MGGVSAAAEVVADEQNAARNELALLVTGAGRSIDAPISVGVVWPITTAAVDATPYSAKIR